MIAGMVVIVIAMEESGLADAATCILIGITEVVRVGLPLNAITCVGAIVAIPMAFPF